MKITRIASVAAIAALLAAASAAIAADKFDFGKREYDSNCAVCHGKLGRGDGPYAGIVDTIIADLTTLAKKNGGVFPFARVVEFVDGRQTVKAHGPRDMPVWGQDYLVKAGETSFDVPYDPEAYVRTRVVALTEYVYRLQAK
jgi:mono/diheme cytochrome c family protein